MFAAAYKVARGFTQPVITAFIRQDGKCGAGIGTFVPVNDAGWCVTAFHIVDGLRGMSVQADATSKYEVQRKAIEDDASLGKNQRRIRLNQLQRPKADECRAYAPWWGWPTVRMVENFGLPLADLAVVRLEGIPAGAVKNYPVFKDPTRDFDHGTSLCRMGFPFSEITPTYNETSGQFDLPPGSLPLPLFPNEGIMTRLINLNVIGAAEKPKFPLQFVETSSPGLRGQSGGPIFDRHGTVWAIQSNTQHYHLGFDPTGPDGKSLKVPPQFLHVGWGVHAETVIGLMQQHNIDFQMSSY